MAPGTLTDQMRANAKRRDEQANVALAQRIALAHDAAAVAEVVAALDDRKLESDAIKVLYEIAALEPQLVAKHAEVLLECLSNKHNRIVWGAMRGLALLVHERRALLAKHLPRLRAVADAGTVITRDGFVDILIGVAPKHAAALTHLAEQLESCPPNQLPMYAERMLAGLGPEASAPFAGILAQRLGELPTAAKAKRVEKVLGKLIGSPARKPAAKRAR